MKPTELKFLVDGMLGSLSTKLRILGYDVVYDKKASDDELIRSALESRRILLTSDSELFLRAKRANIVCFELHETTDQARLVRLFSDVGVSKLNMRRRSRCSLCNGTLIRKSSDKLGRTIYECTSCKKRYWRGSHWQNLESLFERVNKSLLSAHQI